MTQAVNAFRDDWKGKLDSGAAGCALCGRQEWAFRKQVRTVRALYVEGLSRKKNDGTWSKMAAERGASKAAVAKGSTTISKSAQFGQQRSIAP